MKRGTLYIRLGDGILLTDLAKKHGVHVNTVRNWAKTLHIQRGLMMGPHGVRCQALTHAGAKKWVQGYSATGGLDGKP